MSSLRVLGANEEKGRRERLTLIRIFEELRRLGYQGSYDAVRRYAKAWRRERGTPLADAYVPLSFAPGEAYQFDRALVRQDRALGGWRPFGTAEVEAMSRTVSPSAARVYGLALVTRCWKVSRASLY